MAAAEAAAEVGGAGAAGKRFPMLVDDARDSTSGEAMTGMTNVLDGPPGGSFVAADQAGDTLTVA